MKRSLILTLVSAIFIFAFGDAFSQSKARIHIKKNQNGNASEETREVIINNGQNIQDILLELGLLDEFGQLKEGQELEINIDKSTGENDKEQLQFFLSPGNASLPAFPEFAEMPASEKKPFLGVMLKEEATNGEGETAVVITECIAGSAAVKAELLSGDIIKEIDGKEVKAIYDVINAVQSHVVGDKISMRILRGDKVKKVKAVLGEKEMFPPSMRSFQDNQNEMEEAEPNYNFRFDGDSIIIFCPSQPKCVCPLDSLKICQPFSWNGNGMEMQETAFLGVTPGNAPADIQGVRINIEAETSAEKMGLQNGDIIIKFNEISVANFGELSSAIALSKPGDLVTVLAMRDGKELLLSGEIGKRSVSGFDDFRIFHDFKGMDEGGNYFYDYEFDMDAGDVQQHMEQLLNELDMQQKELDEERNKIESELDKLKGQNNETINIKIQIAEISPEEQSLINKQANPKLEINNLLSLDQISFYPNPSDGLLNLNFTTTEKLPIKVLLYNSEGAIVFMEERTIFDGNYKKTIDIADQPSGSYYLQILQNTKSFSKKIVKGL